MLNFALRVVAVLLLAEISAGFVPGRTPLRFQVIMANSMKKKTLIDPNTTQLF